MLGGWRFDGYLLPPDCFVYQSLSGDVFEDFADQFSIADSRSDPAFADFERNPGRYFGGSVSSFDGGYPSLWRHMDVCAKDVGQLNIGHRPKPSSVEGFAQDADQLRAVTRGLKGEGYVQLAEVPRKLCQSLAPDLPGECLQSRLLHRFSQTEGSMGQHGVYGIYGLFKMEDGARIIFPLRYFDSENMAKNALDDYSRTRRNG